MLGTAWHGLLEGDAVRRKLLSWVAERTGRDWTPGTRAFPPCAKRTSTGSRTGSAPTSTPPRSPT